jgi:hypothetical protein
MENPELDYSDFIFSNTETHGRFVFCTCVWEWNDYIQQYIRYDDDESCCPIH